MATSGYASWPSPEVLKAFPSTNALSYALNSSQEAKAACMHLLTPAPAALDGVSELKLSEGRTFLQQVFARELNNGSSGSGAGDWGSYGPHYGGRGVGGGAYGGAPAGPSTLDFTELLLSAACSCSTLRSLFVEKTMLLDTEAGAIARVGTRLEQLQLSTNSSAKPLRRPLVQLMLSQLTNLRELRLSYIRDTTADLARSLPGLTALTRLELSYAYFGSSNAGHTIACALAKHQTQLAELTLEECGVDDAMLDALMDVTSLRSLHIQDEDAPEESHPTNQGLLRIANLQRLERLELFGEELRLDPELLAALARLPSLQHLAVAGLDALHSPAQLNQPSFGLDKLRFKHSSGHGHELGHPGRSNAPQHSSGASDDDYDMSSAGDVNDNDDDDDDASSQSSGMSMEDVTSKPKALLGSGGSETCGAAAAAACTPVADGSGSGAGTPDFPQGPNQLADAQRLGVPPPNYNISQPLHQLGGLTSLVLYGPASLRVFPPALSLLLPQPCLRSLKLSACASAANLRALTYQRGLEKLTLSHSSVLDLYPATSSSAMDFVEDSNAAALVQPVSAAVPEYDNAASSPCHPSQHFPLPQAVGGNGGSPASAGGMGPSSSGQQTLAVSVPMSILGYGPEVAQGLASLVVLRLKDLPGFADNHLMDLVSALAGLPCLRELKLRNLPGVGDAGLAQLPRLGQLQRLKLYALGCCVSEHGLACVAGSMYGLKELKVKGCAAVGPHLAAYVTEARAQLLGPGAPALTVRSGPAECGGSEEAKGEGLGLMPSAACSGHQGFSSHGQGVCSSHMMGGGQGHMMGGGHMMAAVHVGQHMGGHMGAQQVQVGWQHHHHGAAAAGVRGNAYCY